MTSEIINKIKIRMGSVLQKSQMKILEQTLIEIFNEESNTVQIKKDYKKHKIEMNHRKEELRSVCLARKEMIFY